MDDGYGMPSDFSNLRQELWRAYAAFGRTLRRLPRSQPMVQGSFYCLRQWQLWKKHQEELAGLTPDSPQRRLNVKKEYIVIYLAHSYATLPLPQFTREILEFKTKARAKALKKVRKLEQSMLNPLDDSS